MEADDGWDTAYTCTYRSLPWFDVPRKRSNFNKGNARHGRGEKEKIKCGHSSLLMEHVENPEDIDFDSIYLAVEKDDALCTTILKDFGYHTGIAVSNIFALLQPDLVILGGPMYHRFDLFYQTVVQTATERINSLYPGCEVNFSHGNLGENATAIGAGSMVIDSYIA